MSDNYRKQLEGLLQQQYDLRYEYEQRISLTTDPIQRDRDKLTLDGVKKRIRELEDEMGGPPQAATATPSVSTPAVTKNSGTTDSSFSNSELLKIFKERFNVEELQELCFDLDIDYESLSGDSKNGKARELILYMQRNKRLPELTRKVKELRTDLQ